MSCAGCFRPNERGLSKSGQQHLTYLRHAIEGSRPNSLSHNDPSVYQETLLQLITPLTAVLLSHQHTDEHASRTFSCIKHFFGILGKASAREVTSQSQVVCRNNLVSGVRQALRVNGPAGLESAWKKAARICPRSTRCPRHMQIGMSLQYFLIQECVMNFPYASGRNLKRGELRVIAVWFELKFKAASSLQLCHML